MPKRKAIFINARLRVAMEMQIDGLADMQALVGGRIERATTLPNGDDVYVNEEGLLGRPEFFFDIGAHQPFAGSAIVVREQGELRSTLNYINKQVKFMSITDVLKGVNNGEYRTEDRST